MFLHTPSETDPFKPGASSSAVSVRFLRARPELKQYCWQTSSQLHRRLGPADSKSGLRAFGRLSAQADRPNRAKNMSPKGRCGGTPSDLNLFGVFTREPPRRTAVKPVSRSLRATEQRPVNGSLRPGITQAGNAPLFISGNSGRESDDGMKRSTSVDSMTPNSWDAPSWRGPYFRNRHHARPRADTDEDASRPGWRGKPISYFVFRIPYCVLRGDDWTEYAVRNTHHGRLVQPGLCEPSATNDHAIFIAVPPDR